MASGTASFVVAMVVAVPAAAQEGQPQVVAGTAEWRNGTGNCNSGVNNPNFENGTGTPYTDVDMATTVTVEGRHVTVVFTQPGGNRSNFFSPIEGDIADDGTFSVIGQGSFDKRWQWDGQLSGETMAGIFTRETNFAATHENCIATWDVNLRLAGVLPLSGEATTRPTTGERPGTGTSSSSNWNWLPFLAVIAAILALVGGLMWWRSKRPTTQERPPLVPPPPPDDDLEDDDLPYDDDLDEQSDTIGEPPTGVDVVPCGCSCSVTIAGRGELRAGDPKTEWFLEPPTGGPGGQVLSSTADTIRLVAKGRFGELREVYMATVDPYCTGGGSFVVELRTWRIVETTVDHVDLQVVAKGMMTCPDGEEAPVECESTIRIGLRRHCGPDITDQYIVALNRVIGRMRGRRIMVRQLAPAGGTSVDEALLDIEVRQSWDSKRFGPIGAIQFMTVNGAWINFRPYSQDRAKGEPPFWAPGQCPSCQSCGATATVLGRCINLHITDGLLFGLAGAMVGLPKTVLFGGGALAKKLNDHLYTPETRNEVMPAWQLGFDMGTHALADDSYRVTREDKFLMALVVQSPTRSGECKPCHDHVEINGVDWTAMDWAFGTGQTLIYDSPPPPK